MNNDIQRLNQREALIRTARDLHDDCGMISADNEYTRGQAELIAQATVLSHEDAETLKEDLITAIIA